MLHVVDKVNEHADTPYCLAVAGVDIVAYRSELFMALLVTDQSQFLLQCIYGARRQTTRVEKPLKLVGNPLEAITYIGPVVTSQIVDLGKCTLEVLTDLFIRPLLFVCSPLRTLLEQAVVADARDDDRQQRDESEVDPPLKIRVAHHPKQKEDHGKANGHKTTTVARLQLQIRLQVEHVVDPGTRQVVQEPRGHERGDSPQHVAGETGHLQKSQDVARAENVDEKVHEIPLGKGPE